MVELSYQGPLLKFVERSAGAMVFKPAFPVRWVDTDIAGVTHFSNFFRYFEACDEEFYRSLELSLNAIREKYGVLIPPC